ncbi:hypothetical protein [uncultured Dokdonia sp.]|uniref:hypothetical protein n=1 Tax=uncultured Dokdonia sp. TaxID=575653 RepID=UPI0026132E5E|nr:hypothetical protein [uncultured Dokdonia sp.]
MPQDKLYDILWTELADLSYQQELDFINVKFNIDEVIKFMDLVSAFINKLESGIVEGRISKTTNMRSFVISKQTTLFFDIYEDRMVIELLLFWNNQKDPENLKGILKNT